MSDDEPVTPVTVVPPYLSADWQLLRGHLNLAAAHASAGADQSTTEEVRAQINTTLAELRDALFVLARIQRSEDEQTTRKEES